MKKLESFKNSLFTKEAMSKVKGGLAQAYTKTNCSGQTTSVDCTTVLDCGDSDNID